MSFTRSITVLFILGSAAYSQHSPYFPRDGDRGAAQVIREIKNPSVYLFIALAPGFEDLPSIANFRIGSGATVAVAYVTNGEDVPSDLSGEMFYQLASRRKEEAYRALSYLGAQAYFLNIPIGDFSAGSGCFHPTATLDKMVNDRLDSLIDQVRPDILVLDRDPLSGDKESARIAYLKRLIEDRLGDNKKTPAWNIKRFFTRTDKSGNAAVIPVEGRDAVWSKNYLTMAHEAEKFYESLRYQILLWNVGGSHRYVQRYPAETKSSFPLDKELPDIGAQLNTLLPAIHSVNSIDQLGSRAKKLELLRSVIAQIDAFIQSHPQTANPTDSRVLAAWKVGLEKLRCEVLDVKIPYSVSDTIVTPVQVFFLRFGKLQDILSRGKTQVLFPGVVQKQWIVNESQNTFYPLKDSTQFRVLSPRSISLNSTETPQGFDAMQMRTPLVFIVVHEDTDPNRNFMYREELPLIIAPFRSVEVLSSRVMMDRDSSICVRFRSNVRDKTEGAFYVNDAAVSSSQKKVELPGKNSIVTEILPLRWKDTLVTTPREITVRAGRGNSIGSFVVQSVEVKVNTKKRVGICSAIENSPVQLALHRIGVSTTLLDASSFSNNELFKNSAIIVDQFSMKKFVGFGKRLDSLEQWLSRGGRLIILPQYGSERGNQFLNNEITFAQWSVGDCKQKLFVDSTDSIFNLPNKIDEGGFSDDQFVTSYCEIEDKGKDNAKVLMKSGTR
ncbi:MAG: PIG-L family deacetylase, partial [Bacteroidota bacterium]